MYIVKEGVIRIDKLTLISKGAVKLTPLSGETMDGDFWGDVCNNIIKANAEHVRTSTDNVRIMILVAQRLPEHSEYPASVVRNIIKYQEEKLQWRIFFVSADTGQAKRLKKYGINPGNIVYSDMAEIRGYLKTGRRLNMPKFEPKPLLSFNDFNKNCNMDHAGQSQVKTGAGKNAVVSKSTDFAHPMDKSIIDVLNHPAINSVFNKIVGLSMDSQGIEISSGVRVSEGTFPELYEVVKECAASLNIPVPRVVVSSSVQGINAQTAGNDTFAFIELSSLLIYLFSTEELRFVIGHECGHLALGHIVYHTAISTAGSIASLLPVIGPMISSVVTFPLNAWSRASEISADRAGLICCGDAAVAKRTLLKLETGFLDADKMDVDEYVKDSKNYIKNVRIGKLKEALYSHPIIPKRIEAIDLFSESEKYCRSAGKRFVPGDLVGDAELERRTAEIIKVIQ